MARLVKRWWKAAGLCAAAALGLAFAARALDHALLDARVDPPDVVSVGGATQLDVWFNGKNNTEIAYDIAQQLVDYVEDQAVSYVLDKVGIPDILSTPGEDEVDLIEGIIDNMKYYFGDTYVDQNGILYNRRAIIMYFNPYWKSIGLPGHTILSPRCVHNGMQETVHKDMGERGWVKE